MFDIHELPQADFAIGDYVRVVGANADEWESEPNLRICEIRYLRDWKRYSYGIIDGNGFFADGWSADDIVKTSKGTEQ